jgi:alkylation response protein AidB-like acyl-CoA dehydrogenase
MNFSDNETQSLLRDTANRLIRDKYDFDTRKKYLASPQGYSAALWKEYGELGLLGIDASEDHGGSGGTFADLAVVLEAFGRGLALEPYLSSIILSAEVLRASGDTAAQQEYLPKLASGELKMALAHGEPASRYDLTRVETTAKADGGNHVLNGHKAVVLGAEDADVLVIAARMAGAIKDADGISLFSVEAGTPGLTIRGFINMDDRRAGEVLLENVRAKALIGEEGRGLAALQAAVDRATAAVCCEAVGAMDAVNQLTLEYLKTRSQFGRPIGKFQVLQHRMADMMMAEQSARSMLALAIANADNQDVEVRAKAVSAAKVQIGNSGNIVGRGAVQLHGGIGMTMELAAAHYFRRLTAIEKMFGDTDYHLARFVAAKAL